MQEERLDSLSSRLKYALEKTNTRQADLARTIGVKPQIIQYLCNGDVKTSRFCFEIAEALGLTTKWLAIGEGEMYKKNDIGHSLLSKYHPIPIVDISKVSIDMSIEINSQDPIAALDTKLDDLFAVKMPDASMEPILPTGSLVFFQRTKQSILSADRVGIFYMDEFDTCIIRKVTNQGGNVFLAPENTSMFKEIPLTDKTKAIGIAIECHYKINPKGS